MRASDIAARVGGDEFVVMLPETNAKNAMAVLERVRNALETTVGLHGLGITARCSVSRLVASVIASDGVHLGPTDNKESPNIRPIGLSEELDEFADFIA